MLTANIWMFHLKRKTLMFLSFMCISINIQLTFPVINRNI